MPEEFVAKSAYFFSDPEEYDEASRKKNWKPETPAQLHEVLTALAPLPQFTVHAIEEVVRTVAEKHQIGAGKLIHPLRLAVTGLALGPGLFELMEVLGPDICLRRIHRAVERLAV